MNGVEHRNLVDLAEHRDVSPAERAWLNWRIGRAVRLTDVEIATISAIRGRIARAATCEPDPPTAA